MGKSDVEVPFCAFKSQIVGEDHGFPPGRIINVFGINVMGLQDIFGEALMRVGQHGDHAVGGGIVALADELVRHDQINAIGLAVYILIDPG